MVNAQQYLDKNYPKEIRSQITDLDISNRGLEGSLKIEGFTNLRKLNIAFNEITGTTFGDSTNSIEEIDLSHNKIGSIGYIIAPKLKKYSFSHNNFEENTLISPNLTYLDASNNALSKLNLKSTNDLQALDCSNNLNLTRDKLFLPNNFNPASLDCQNTSLDQIRFSNSSVFDCQVGKFVEETNSPLPSFSPQPISDNGLSSSDKIALGTGIGLGVPGLALTAFGTWVGYRQLKITWKEYKEGKKEKERIRTSELETKTNELGEGSSRVITEESVSNEVVQSQQAQIEQIPYGVPNSSNK